ncbi:hypothetical protein EF847_09170 [Actinobacteria bacterium YIM 96077]|uniref:DUF2567 domain-containing protein n=1 Tax=Phytoactinopolyspora halophila TaxID=1981511 RepID=A0A329QV92_9ACTN|nr:hypothetical protein [Phytoactinopolyspora halophila]AYY12857.1 hypothetical protein EF847_09170 [Actinobacteria bacterium YIM 96077]RAW16350.1 hypothetical protein DPM12_06850 [Phytoactinopolyspora halophila]
MSSEADTGVGTRAHRHGAAGRSRRPPLTPRRVAAEIVVLSLVFGALYGVAWYALAPEITGQVDDNGVAIPIEEARELFDRVAVFALLSAGIGLILGVVSGLRHRGRPVTALATLVLGGAGGSLLALGVGILLGPAESDDPPGTPVALPMELDTPSALFVWPLVALIVVTVMTVARDDRTPWSAGSGEDEGRDHAG